jgi:hypothetical protein
MRIDLAMVVEYSGIRHWEQAYTFLKTVKTGKVFFRVLRHHLHNCSYHSKTLKIIHLLSAVRYQEETC